jgi:hypothetical protein
MDQASEVVVNEGGEEFWREHVLRAQNFRGTDSAYCRSQGIDRKQFSYYKRMLGYGKPRRQPKVFVEVKPKIEGIEKNLVRVEPKKLLPDAKWLAEFAGHLLSQIK